MMCAAIGYSARHWSPRAGDYFSPDAAWAPTPHPSSFLLQRNVHPSCIALLSAVYTSSSPSAPARRFASRTGLRDTLYQLHTQDCKHDSEIVLTSRNKPYRSGDEEVDRGEDKQVPQIEHLGSNAMKL